MDTRLVPFACRAASLTLNPERGPSSKVGRSTLRGNDVGPGRPAVAQWSPHRGVGGPDARRERRASLATDRTALLTRLAHLVADAPRSTPLAGRLAQACRDLLLVDGVWLTIEATTPNRVTLAATDPIAARLDRLEEILGQGPVWDAYRTGAPQSADLTAERDDRWPEFIPAAREAVGARTVFGLPMRPAQETIGVMSVHVGRARELPTGLDTGLFLADTIGAALLLDPTQHQSDGRAGPWSGRAEVHQATGMLIAQLGVNSTDALALLKAHAYAGSTTLDDIAGQVITRRLDFRKDTP